MPYQVLRIEKRKGGAIAHIAKHIDRTQESPSENVDPSKTINNRDLINDHILSATEVKARIDEKLLPVERKIRGDQVRCVEFLLSASADYFRPDSNMGPGEWDDDRLSDWVGKTQEFIEKEIRPRAISATLHLDELTPHIHVLAVPIHDLEKYNLNAKNWVGTREKLREWHDRYNEYMQPIGLDRGERSDRQHISPQQYRNHHRKIDDRESELLGLQSQLNERDRHQQQQAQQNQHLAQQLAALQAELEEMRRDGKRKEAEAEKILSEARLRAIAAARQQLLLQKKKATPPGYHWEKGEDGDATLLCGDRAVMRMDLEDRSLTPMTVSDQDVAKFSQHLEKELALPPVKAAPKSTTKKRKSPKKDEEQMEI